MSLVRAGHRSRFALLLAAGLAVGCGSGRPESPESLAREAFEQLRDGSLPGFLSKQAQLEDIVRECPELTAMERVEAQAELTLAQTEAVKSYNACREAVQFDGAVFERADRAPGEILTLRFHGCGPSLSYPAMRVLFRRNGVRGNVYIINVFDFAGRWAHRSGVRLCEQSVPQ